MQEIAAAYSDALETVPYFPLFAPSTGVDHLYHLAPHVAMKFRGLPEPQRAKAVETALASFVANEPAPSLKDPRIAFAFCYLAAHSGLRLVSDAMVEDVMNAVAARPEAVAPL